MQYFEDRTFVPVPDMRILSAFILLLYFCTTDPLRAQTSRKYSNEFLQIGVDARQLGMGGTGVVGTRNVASGYWNPAGLMGIESHWQAGLMHAEYFAGIAKYDYGAMGRPLGNGMAGALTMIRFGVDDIPNTTQLIDNNGNIDYNRITSFSAADYGFLASLAKSTAVEGLDVGATSKIVYRQVGDFAQSWGFGIDAGAQFQKNRWRFGGTWRDVFGTFNFWSFSLDQTTREVFTRTGNEIPENGIELTLPRFILGVGYQQQLNQNLDLFAEYNLHLTTDGQRNVFFSTNDFPISGDPLLGLELGYRRMVFLRLGAQNLQEIPDVQGKDRWTVQPNMGLGLQLGRLGIDYALSNVGNVSDVLYSHIISLRADFVPRNSGSSPAP